MRVVLYARSSTTKDQKPELQIEEMREYSRHRGFNIVSIDLDLTKSSLRNNKINVILGGRGSANRRLLYITIVLQNGARATALGSASDTVTLVSRPVQIVCKTVE